MRDPVAPATPSFVESFAGPPVDENLDGERKTITALFADIKGSMNLIEDLDPEEARAIVDPALRLMIEAARVRKEVLSAAVRFRGVAARAMRRARRRRSSVRIATPHLKRRWGFHIHTTCRVCR
jgi:hypothetical protein